MKAIHICSDRLGICMQLGENSCLPPENIVGQTCFAKQTFIQIKSLFVQTHSDYQ